MNDTRCWIGEGYDDGMTLILVTLPSIRMLKVMNSI